MSWLKNYVSTFCFVMKTNFRKKFFFDTEIVIILGNFIISEKFRLISQHKFTNIFQVTRILMGGPQKFVIPDYKKYTVGKHTPELLQLQQHLRQRGLKDPWIRTGNMPYKYRLGSQKISEKNCLNKIFSFFSLRILEIWHERSIVFNQTSCLHDLYKRHYSR